MDFLFDMAEVEAVNKTAEGSNNEIKKDNFIEQATKLPILEEIPNCNGKTNPDDMYLELYNYLILKKVITKKVGLATIFTWDIIYTIDKSKLNNLSTLLNRSNTDFPAALKCYNINYTKLTSFLTNYSYKTLDEYKRFHKGGKNKKTKKRRKTLRKQNKKE